MYACMYEAWAVLQAALLAHQGSCTYRIDCDPCVQALIRGVSWATSAKRKHAWVHKFIYAAIGGTPSLAFVWIPTHTQVRHVGVRALGDGSLR